MPSITLTNTDGLSVTLGNHAPFYIEKITGLSEVSVQFETQKAPKQHGATYFDSTLGEREITIEGTIITRQNLSELQGKKRLLQQVVNPLRVQPIKLTYEHESSVREIEATVESTPIFPNDEGNRGLYYQKFMLVFICHQPFWQDVYTESREMSYLMGGLQFGLRLPTSFAKRGFQRAAVNAGDVATPVEIEFKGAAVNPTVTNETTGQAIKVNRSLGPDDVLTIGTAFGKKYVRINGENAFHYLDLSSVFWQLEPGSNILSYASNNDSINTRVKVTWKNRYVGI